MIPAKVADRGSTANTATTNPTVVTVTADTTLGNYMIARVAVDNSGTSGARPGLAVTDSRSNTWTVGTGGLIDPGVASAGSACYIAYTRMTTALLNADTISFTWTTAGGSPFAKAIVVEEWSGIRTTTPVAVAEVQASGSTTAFTITNTATAIDQLWYGVCSVEGPTGDTFPSDADVVALTRLSTADATATNNQTNNGAYRIATAAAATTWNGTLGTTRDWAAAAVIFAPILDPISTLTERFDTADATKWTFTASATVTGGRVQIVPDGAYDFDVASIRRYDLTASSLFVEVPSPVSGTAVDTMLWLWLDNPSNDDALRIYYESPNLYCGTRVAGVDDVDATTYDPVAHRWWRIREAAGTCYFETSPDGITWTVRRSLANPAIGVTTCQVLFNCGFSGADPGAVFSVFDNVNLAKIPDQSRYPPPGSAVQRAATW